jgi:hypothetical protein
VGTPVHRCHSGCEHRISPVWPTWLALIIPPPVVGTNVWLGPMRQTPLRRGGLYTDSPDNGSQQGESSPLVFPTLTDPGCPSSCGEMESRLSIISVTLETDPGWPSPCGEMEARYLFLSLKISDINGIAAYLQWRSPGLQHCSGGGACTNANPMTMLNGPRTSTFKQDYPGVGLVGVSLDGRAHQTTFGSMTTLYFSPRNFRQP